MTTKNLTLSILATLGLILSSSGCKPELAEPAPDVELMGSLDVSVPCDPNKVVQPALCEADLSIDVTVYAKDSDGDGLGEEIYKGALAFNPDGSTLVLAASMTSFPSNEDRSLAIKLNPTFVVDSGWRLEATDSTDFRNEIVVEAGEELPLVELRIVSATGDGGCQEGEAGCGCADGLCDGALICIENADGTADTCSFPEGECEAGTPGCGCDNGMCDEELVCVDLDEDGEGLCTFPTGGGQMCTPGEGGPNCECAMNEDCADGLECQNNFCTQPEPPCNGQLNCACANDEECSGTLVCNNGFCDQPLPPTPCDNDEQCGYGTVCDEAIQECVDCTPGELGCDCIEPDDSCDPNLICNAELGSCQPDVGVLELCLKLPNDLAFTDDAVCYNMQVMVGQMNGDVCGNLSQQAVDALIVGQPSLDDPSLEQYLIVDNNTGWVGWKEPSFEGAVGGFINVHAGVNTQQWNMIVADTQIFGLPPNGGCECFNDQQCIDEMPGTTDCNAGNCE